MALALLVADMVCHESEASHLFLVLVFMYPSSDTQNHRYLRAKIF